MTWLEQKLAQNGFTLEDLAQQSGLSLQQIQELAQTQRGTSPQWDLVLGVLNSYPSVRIPSSDILDQLQNDLQTYPDGQAMLFYGVSDGAITFTGYQNLSDGAYHGSNTDQTYLSRLVCSLDQALTLFTRQNAASQFEVD